MSNPSNYYLDRKVILSSLWIFILMNMIYADIIGMLKPGYLDNLDKLSKELSPGIVLLFSFFMEIPIIMILLSRVLARRANRLAHFVATPLSILWVIVPALMPSLGTTPLSYVFFATVEVLSMVMAFWIALKWPRTYDSSLNVKS